MSSYRDEREAAIARADALERENRALREQISHATRSEAEGSRFTRWAIIAGVAAAVLLGGGMLLVSRVDLVPPDIDSPPGVYGTLRLEVSPARAQVRVDDGVWQSVNGHVNFAALDPNFPHRVIVSAPGYTDEVRTYTVPAHGIRRETIELTPAPNP